MFKTITYEQEEEWNNAITLCSRFDFYHTWDYHNLSRENNEGNPLLFCFKDEIDFIYFPVMLREIPTTDGYYDFTSVYGYAGPLFSETITAEKIQIFVDEVKSYCLKHKIVAGFSRLHPLFDQLGVLSNLGEVVNNSETVCIDLTLTLQEQRKDYRKSNKSEINQLRKKASIIWSSKDDEAIAEFRKIYDANMRRVAATDYYFFDDVYYNNFLNSNAYRAELLFVEMEGKKVAAAIFVFSGDIIQYHLAGTDVDYLRVAPIKYLLDEIRIYGTEQGYKFLHLGGGTSANEEDPLLRFKRGFSKSMKQFTTFKSIFDDEMYVTLSEKCTESEVDFDLNYFPLYRKCLKN